MVRFELSTQASPKPRYTNLRHKADQHADIYKALCHCADCRKMSGSIYSANVIIPDDGFKITSGKPKTISKKADSGNTITSYFCGTSLVSPKTNPRPYIQI